MKKTNKSYKPNPQEILEERKTECKEYLSELLNALSDKMAGRLEDEDYKEAAEAVSVMGVIARALRAVDELPVEEDED